MKTHLYGEFLLARRSGCLYLHLFNPFFNFRMRKMTPTALIFIHAPTPDSKTLPRALIEVGGLSVLERQLRQAARMGITRAVVAIGAFAEEVEAKARKFRRVPQTVEIVSLTDFVPAVRFRKTEPVLLIEEGVVIDGRILKEVLGDPEKPKRKVAIYPESTVIPGKGLGLKLKAEERELLFASAALVFGGDVEQAAADAEFRKVPMKAVLKAALGPGKAGLLDVSKMPTYLQDRRREVAMIWRPVATREDARKATRALIANAQKGVLDWPARWIHPFFEDFLTEILSPLPVTPNMITVVTGIAGFYVTYLFATGQLMFGLVGALVIGVLDGVDGKLARVKMNSTRLGEFEHILDKLVEYSWYFAIAWHLATVAGNALPWALASIIVLFAWAETVQGEFFRRLTGRQLDDAGRFERAFRIVAARRNTQMWLLIPFAATGTWLLGFWCIAFYAAATFFVAQARFIIRVREYASEKSLEIKKNFEDTAYF